MLNRPNKRPAAVMVPAKGNATGSGRPAPSAGLGRGLSLASAGVVKRRTETPERAAAATADLFDRQTPLIGVQLANSHRTSLLD